ncbi:MAG: hypothetical protein ABIH59_00040 [archaeon]
MLKKMLILDPCPTSMTYKMLYFLRNYFDIRLISLSTKFNKKDYEELGIPGEVFDFQGRRYLRDKKFIKGTLEVLNFLSRMMKLRLSKHDFVLARTEPNLIGYFLFKFFKNSKKIYLPYDISLFRFGQDTTKRSKIDIVSEKYCFQKADYIIHKGPKEEISWIRKSEINNIKGKIINFLPYCFDGWMQPIKKEKDKLKGINLVYIGGVDRDDPRYRIQIKDIFKKIAETGINLHCYSLDPVDKELHKRIFIHNPLDNKELNKKMGKYHYGINIFFNNNKVDPRWPKTALSNKILSYLEAGIPIIITKEITFMTEIVEKYGCGVVIEEKDLKNLKNILKKQNYPRILKGVEKARKDLLMSKKIKNLIKDLT